MLVAGIVAVWDLLLVLAFGFPRLSRHPERGVGAALGAGTGREARGRLPLRAGRTEGALEPALRA